nr:MAG TPA: hypothetical protein [Caudoviricetes sp.]
MKHEKNCPLFFNRGFFILGTPCALFIATTF